MDTPSLDLVKNPTANRLWQTGDTHPLNEDRAFIAYTFRPEKGLFEEKWSHPAQWNTGLYRRAKRKAAKARAASIREGVTFALPLCFFLDVTTCGTCGAPLAEPTTYRLARKDKKLGFTKENCQRLCRIKCQR